MMLFPPLVLGALACLGMLRNGFYRDDFTWVSGAIRALDHPWFLVHLPGKPDFRPLVTATFVANLWISGTNPAGYALFNILLHLVNTALVVRLVHRVTEGRRVVALTAGALFAVAFGNCGLAVVWICGRTSLLADLFVLLSLLAYWSWLEHGRLRDRGASVGCFVLALLSKESAVMLVPMLVLAEWMESRSSCGPLRGTRAARLLPHAVVLAGYLVFCFGWWRRGSPVLRSEYVFGAHAVRNLAEYLVRMIVPVTPSSMLVPVPHALQGVATWVMGALLVLVPAAWLVVFVSRSPRAVRFGILWMVLNLLPYVWFRFRTNTRYLYDPSIGLCIVVAVGLAAWQSRADRSGRPAAVRALPALAWVALVVAAALLLNTVIVQWGQAGRRQDPRLQAALTAQLSARRHSHG